MPRLWKQRRHYQPDGPLYATRRLQFSGRVVESQTLIPPEYLSSKRQHLTLWRSGHATHAPRKPLLTPPIPAPVPADVEATAQLPAASASIETAHTTEAASVEAESEAIEPMITESTPEAEEAVPELPPTPPTAPSSKRRDRR